jgi:hypothetical protein
MTNTGDIFWFLLMLCIWCHIIDDFVLQAACLSNLKQRDWWKKQIGEMFEYSPYREDYVVALIVHGLSWSFSILIPMIGYQLLTGTPLSVSFFWTAFCLNGLIHGIVDHLKANEQLINLVVDQGIHLVQILFTLFIFVTRY